MDTIVAVAAYYMWRSSTAVLGDGGRWTLVWRERGGGCQSNNAVNGCLSVAGGRCLFVGVDPLCGGRVHPPPPPQHATNPKVTTLTARAPLEGQNNGPDGVFFGLECLLCLGGLQCPAEFEAPEKATGDRTEQGGGVGG